MPSDVASRKKIKGHEAERIFSSLIGGRSVGGSSKNKKDVIDSQGKTHSVKTGEWWQIFLYRRSRLQRNTVLQGLGDIANTIITCIDIFPEDFNDYESNKHQYKTALQVPMQKLCSILQSPTLRRGFFNAAFFNEGEVDYLSAWYEETGAWHIFPADFVADYLTTLEIANSKAKNNKQHSDQKVLIRDGINIGEIEMRNDSPKHYREIKFRINGGVQLLKRLIAEAGTNTTLCKVNGEKIYLHENAQTTFKLP